MSDTIHRLNELGLLRFESYLNSFQTGTPEQWPQEWLTHPETSEPLGVSIAIERRTFPRRFEAAQYLFSKLHRLDLPDIERDKGLWAWLALYFFDQLCPPDRDGRRRPAARVCWIPEIDAARRYYRHLLLGPFLIFRTHAREPGLVEPILCDSMHISTSEHFRTVVETQQFITSPAVIAAVGRLYYNPQTGRLVRGAGTKRGGGVRRLGSLLRQFDMTFDLHSIDPEALLLLLPEEFREIKRRSRVA